LQRDQLGSAPCIPPSSTAATPNQPGPRRLFGGGFPFSVGSSYDHLRNALAAQRLAAHKGLALDGGQEVADARDGEEDGRRDEAGGPAQQAQPLGSRHGRIRSGAHVVGRDFANAGVERRRRGTDPEQQWHFDEEDNEGGDPIGIARLAAASAGATRIQVVDLQADDAEDDDEDAEGEDVSDAQGKA